MTGDVNKELNKFNFKNDNSFDIKSIIRFIIDNYKQILLLLLVFVIIYVVDHITYYNTMFYGLTSAVPSIKPEKIKSNTFKKKLKK
jgi:hypothetical protein